MRKILFFLGLLCLCAPAHAKPAKPVNSIKAAAHKLDTLTDTDIDWNTAKAKTANVTCSGDDDRVLFGTGGGSVWIGIVSARARPQLMDFPLSHRIENGFCAKPKKISLSPLSCRSGKLEDCKPVRSCKQFSVDDGDCDPFTFYWDSRHQIVRWRR